MLPNSTMFIPPDNGSFPSLADYDQHHYDVATVGFIAVLSIIGTIGNIHTLLVYTLSPELHKLPVRVLIIWLSATDLIACAASMPFEIFIIRFDNTFSSPVACKFFRFVNFFTAYNSGGLLTIIAIQRFKISSRLNFRKGGRTGYLIHTFAILVTVVSILLSIPGLVCYDVVQKETPFNGLNGTVCHLLPKYQDIKILLVYMVITALLSSTCFIVVVALYSKILYTIRVQMRKVSTTHKMQSIKRHVLEDEISTVNSAAQMLPSKEHKEPEEYSSGVSTASQMLQSHETDEREEHNSGVSSAVQANQINEKPEQKEDTSKVISTAQKKQNQSRYEKGRQLTITLIVATAVSYIGYILHISQVVAVAKNSGIDINKGWPPGLKILFRADFINNAVNPVVYCLLDSKFRRECIKLYKHFKFGRK